jgi:hypothetical protein
MPHTYTYTSLLIFLLLLHIRYGPTQEKMNQVFGVSTWSAYYQYVKDNVKYNGKKHLKQYQQIHISEGEVRDMHLNADGTVATGVDAQLGIEIQGTGKSMAGDMGKDMEKDNHVYVKQDKFTGAKS